MEQKPCVKDGSEPRDKERKNLDVKKNMEPMYLSQASRMVKKQTGSSFEPS